MFIEIKNTSKKCINKNIDQRSLKDIFKRVLYLYMFKPDDYAYLDKKYGCLYGVCLESRKVYTELVDLSKDFNEEAFDRVIADDNVYNEKIRKIL